MGDALINRRSAITYLCTLVVALPGFRFWREARGCSFYVAGARYFPRQRLRVGDTVVLQPTLVAGESAFRVETVAGAPLGFVPKLLVPRLANPRRARVDAVALDGVPWRWYRISLAG